jgi:uncharacterized membrane protein YidH (DUF202 family)
VVGLVLFVVGLGVLVTGRWRAVARADAGRPDVRFLTRAVPVGLALLVVGTVVFVAFLLTPPGAVTPA